MAHLYPVRDAATLDAARPAAGRLINTFDRAFPAAVACFRDDLDALLAIHRYRFGTASGPDDEPGRAVLAEERRRGTVIGRFSDERSAMKLVFATMIRAAERWCRVSISDIERHQLKLLRAELGVDPPPATSSRKTVRRRNVAA